MSHKGIIKKVVHTVPKPVRKTFRKLTRRITGLGGAFRSWVSPSVSILRGAEKAKGARLSLLYCGDDTPYRNYIRRIAFGLSGRTRDLGRMPIWKIRALLRDKRKPFDAAWIEWNPVTSLVFRSTHAFKVPRWVEAWLDLPDQVEKLKKSGFKSTIRRIHSEGYTYTVTRDRDLYDHFYYRMYEPTIRGIHGDGAYIISYPFFESLYDRTELLLVTQQEELIAGILLQYEEGDALLAYLGFEEGNHRFVEDGAAGALDYFAALWLKKKGYSTVSLGGSKSFLNDGVLRSKMLKRGRLRMRKHILDENVLFYPVEENPGLRGFLLGNPFLTYTEEGTIEGVLFSHPYTIGDEQIAEVAINPYRQYHGIEAWQVNIFEDGGTAERKIVGPRTGTRITVKPFRTCGGQC